MVRNVDWSGERVQSAGDGTPDEDRIEQTKVWDVVPELDDEDLPDLTTLDGWRRRSRREEDRGRPGPSRRHLSGADWTE